MPNNPFDATYLFGSTGGRFGPYAYAFLGLTLAVLALCIWYYSTLGKSRFRGHGLRAKLADRAAILFTVWSVVVLFVYLMRLLQVPGISTRFVFVLLLAAGAALVAYYVHYYRARYPVLLTTYEAERRKMRYIPPASMPGASTYHRRRKVRRR